MAIRSEARVAPRSPNPGAGARALALAGVVASLALGARPAAAQAGDAAAPARAAAPGRARADSGRATRPGGRGAPASPDSKARDVAKPESKEGASSAKSETKDGAAANAKPETPGNATSPASRRGKTAKRASSDPSCVRDRVELGRATGEADTFSLVRCDGKPADGAAERLSILLRPYSAPKPALPAGPPAEGRGREWAPGVRSADPGLLTRLQAFADRYRGRRIVIVSGYRPTSVGSFHKDARAVDLRVDGVRNEELVAFCRGLRDTGCGFYPNSSFIHVDVRPAGTGHVYWIDASGPGEAPRYVSSWPPPRDEPLLERLPKPEEAAPRDEHTHPDVAGKRAGRGLGASDRSDEGLDAPAAPPAPAMRNVPSGPRNAPPRSAPPKAATDAERSPPPKSAPAADERSPAPKASPADGGRPPAPKPTPAADGERLPPPEEGNRWEDI